jgi:hypothetical protein
MNITKHCMASTTSTTVSYCLLHSTTTAHGWRPALVPACEAIRVRDSARYKHVYSHNHSHNHCHKTPTWPPHKHQNLGPTARPLPRGTLLRTRSKGYTQGTSPRHSMARDHEPPQNPEPPTSPSPPGISMGALFLFLKWFSVN